MPHAGPPCQAGSSRPEAPAAQSGQAPPAPPRDRDRPPRRLAALPYVIVLAGVLGGLLWVWLSQTHVKGGIVVIASALLLAGGARLVLTDERAGLLASRRRSIDVATFAILGIGLLVSALLLKNPS
jgi:Protein of unknown function (DUF3017)